MLDVLRAEQPRHVKFSLPVQENGPHAWYLVKAYGRQGPIKAAWLDVLSYVEYDVQDMLEQMRRTAEQAVRTGRISPEERREIMAAYENGLRGYTYFER